MADPDYADDPSIPGEAVLWRRIPPHHFVRDENRNSIRPSSAAFEDHPDGSPMSVVLAAEAAGPLQVLAGHPGFALAAFPAGLARDCEQKIVRDPLPDDPAHALVVGKKTRSVRKRLAVESVWAVSPPTE